jgi:serine/threonine protein kinase
MTAERWRRLERMFHEALARPQDERGPFLSASCADDPALRVDAIRLIEAHARLGAFIDEPAVETMRPASAAADEPGPGACIGRYRVIREIAHGGMGAVYLAHCIDPGPHDRVAVKVVKAGMDTAPVLDWFRAERRILAQLDHPNIARLLDASTMADGRPYLVMEYVEGLPIDEFADAGRLSVRARLALFVAVCRAVSHAHSRRIVHRDVKPTNVLVTAGGEPKLLDFGIATVLDADMADERAAGSYPPLTPEYASPEQVDGRRATPASDVYSLGVVLYELLTGRSPYRVDSRDPLRIAEAVRTTNPCRPSTAISRIGRQADRVPRRRRLADDRALATSLPSVDALCRRLRGDLDSIVLKALRKDPARRYHTAAELADDIQRHLDGRRVFARSRPAKVDSVNAAARQLLLRPRVPVVRGPPEPVHGAGVRALGTLAVRVRHAHLELGVGEAFARADLKEL